MDTFIKIIVCLFAGLGAGVGTGLAGMSAACVIAPMLIVCLDMDPYLAVAIGLASDVLASGVSAFIYGKNKHIKFSYEAITLLVSVLIFTLIGSYLGYITNKANEGVSSRFSLYVTLLIGLKFLIFPVRKHPKIGNKKSKIISIIIAIIGGMFVGLTCGFVGAGGGMMMLMILTIFMHFNLKEAVGTSVFIMTFTALVGSGTHFILADYDIHSLDVLCLVLCVIFTLLFAQLSSLFANKIHTKTLNIVLGASLLVLGITMIIINYYQTRSLGLIEILFNYFN